MLCTIRSLTIITVKKHQCCLRCSQKLQRERNKQYQKDYYAEWYQTTGRVRNINPEIMIEWRKNNPEKELAKIVVAAAIRKGLLIRPTIRTSCGKEARLHGHHTDYTKMLDVTWLCASCHKQLHADMKK